MLAECGLLNADFVKREMSSKIDHLGVMTDDKSVACADLHLNISPRYCICSFCRKIFCVDENQ